MDNRTLLQTKLKWEKNSNKLGYFYVYISENLILLRLNNFPDEPMFSLINGLEITDFDDAPDYWEIPYE